MIGNPSVLNARSNNIPRNCEKVAESTKVRFSHAQNETAELELICRNPDYYTRFLEYCSDGALSQIILGEVDSLQKAAETFD